HLHVWGRPFFITDESPEEVSAGIDRYLAATPRQVDAIARDMLRKMRPGLEKQVQPSAEGSLPGDADLAQGIRGRIDLLRDAYAAMMRGETFQVNDEEHDPQEVLASDLPFLVVDFAANFTPGWMARGYVWPTHLLAEAGLDVDEFFGTAAGVFAP